MGVETINAGCCQCPHDDNPQATAGVIDLGTQRVEGSTRTHGWSENRFCRGRSRGIDAGIFEATVIREGSTEAFVGKNSSPSRLFAVNPLMRKYVHSTATLWYVKLQFCLYHSLFQNEEFLLLCE